ncbi:DUF2218 domain-containing protein [Teichococcus aestuarii]|uniref:DUF2218 domain-containing protein n=1 Tax=Teichococcus aestuarii TaxID=568898 RepID=UPI003611C0C3
MRFESRATVPTAHASRYLQQLCKHWSHNLAVEFTADEGKIVFPRDARGGLARCRHAAAARPRRRAGMPPAASAEGQLAGLKGVVERHLDRFAFREAPLAFAWQDAA